MPLDIIWKNVDYHISISARILLSENFRVNVEWIFIADWVNEERILTLTEPTEKEKY